MELTSASYFYSLIFLFLLYWFLPKKLNKIILLLGSYALYSLWDLRFIAVLIGSTILDFSLGLYLAKTEEEKKRKWVLLLSLFSNLGILGFFKYVNFFQDTLYLFLTNIGLSASKHTLSIFIPLGVSFYTFHSISYIIDIYRRKTSPSRRFIEYALYVSFFPKLICGPIERSENFIPQIRNRPNFQLSTFINAIALLVYGLFLKLCISDRLDFITNRSFSNETLLSTMDLWFGYYAYAFQIFTDFYGYTLIARGSAQLFGISLEKNFLTPYLSTTPQEFWRRWHTTLSFWFRDYVYISLGGKKYPYRNTMITMMLAGLWHGADMRYVFWGIYHGTLVLTQRALGIPTQLSKKLKPIGIIITFHLVAFGWVFFRAKTFSQAIAYIKGMFLEIGKADEFSLPSAYWLFVLLGVWILSALLMNLQERIKIKNNSVTIMIPVKMFLLGCILSLILLLGSSNAAPFVYFYF